MKYLRLILFCFVGVFSSACSQHSTNQIAITSSEAITHSHNLLIEKGIESGWDYESANFAVIQFPSGKQGIFIALGYTGIGRGYQLLYQVTDSQLDLISLNETRIVWGVGSLRNSGQPRAKTEIEFFDDLLSNRSELGQIIKVIGAGHMGSGLWDDSYFQILEITETGLREIFTGLEFTTNSTTFDTRNHYEFADLDGDNNKEIIERSEHCEYRLSYTEVGRQELGCTELHTIFIYDGVRYSPSTE